MSLVATSEREWRSARRPVLPVTLRGILAAAGTMMVSGPGAVGFAPFGLKHTSDGAEVEGVGHQQVQRIGGDRHYLTAAHGGGGPFEGFGLGILGIDFDQVGCHLELLSVSDLSGVRWLRQRRSPFDSGRTGR